MRPPAPESSAPLTRAVGLPGACALGLGAMLGTGVFVAPALAAGQVDRPWKLHAAVLAAGGLAACNATSSARLAAHHPVAGGAYAQALHLLPRPVAAPVALCAGWLFLAAKSLSAATAMLALSAALIALLSPDAAWAVRPLAVGGALGCTILVLEGLRRTARVNALLVAGVLAVLVGFIVRAFGHAAAAPVHPPAGDRLGFAAAAALVFVAYTGYGRLATLAEEVRRPTRTLPLAIGLTLLTTAALYLAVTAAALHLAGLHGLARAGRNAGNPLLAIAPDTATAWALGAAAALALIGVTVNLVLGLSRVALAMARHRHLPAPLARVRTGSATPTTPATPALAVITTGGAVAALTLLGDIRLTWSLSAAAVLAYYAINNAIALRLPGAAGRATAGLGLLGCIALAAAALRTL